MSIIGTRPRDGRVGPALSKQGCRAIDPPAKSSAETPYRLLWSAGIIVFALSMAAFVLWGINGAGTLFDMIVAFCT